jgi:hypothetical protein
MTRPGELTSHAVSVTTRESGSGESEEVVPTNPSEPPCASTPTAERHRALSPGRITAAAAVLALLPYLYDLVRFAADFGQRVVMWGDDAAEALAVRDVWRGHQLLGPYSRYGWHHPGPALFYWLALPDRILGSRGPGIVSGTILLNAVATGAVVVILGRRWGPWLALWAAGCLSLLHLALGGYLWRDFWNPYAVILPMVLLVVLAADAATGVGASWCWALVVGSFVIQTHISTAPSVLLILAVGLVGLLWSWHSQRTRPFRRWPALAGLAVTALLWLPPLIDAVRHHPSNVSLLVKFFTAPHPSHTLGEAGRTSLSAATTVFFGRHGPISAVVVRSTVALGAGALIFAVLVVATLGIGLARRHPLGPWLALISTVGFAAAILGGTRVVGDISQYLTVWQAYLPITLLLGLGAALLADVPDVRPARSSAPSHLSPPAGPLSLLTLGSTIIAVAGALTGAALTVGQTAALAGPTQFPGYLPPAEVAQATDLIRSALQPSDRVVRLTITTQSAWPTVAGVALELERGGRRTTEVGTPGSGVDAGVLFGAGRRPTGHEDVDIEFERQGVGEVQGAAAHGAPLGVVGTLSVLINRTAISP